MTCSVLLAVVVVKDFGLQWHRETSRLLRQLFMSLSGPEFMASRMDTLLDWPMFQQPDKVIRIFTGFNLFEPRVRATYITAILLAEERFFALLVLSKEWDRWLTYIFNASARSAVAVLDRISFFLKRLNIKIILNDVSILILLRNYSNFKTESKVKPFSLCFRFVPVFDLWNKRADLFRILALTI